MSLDFYRQKRNFKETPEPRGKISRASKFRFVVQRHQATRLHYDLRLELDGVLKSWAVPKGPSLNPIERRLAMQTEDHPVEYLEFQGSIPQGNYGAGVMEVWDTGAYFPVNKDHEKITEKEALKNLQNGELKFLVAGKKIAGEFVLVRLKDGRSWLLIKHRDDYATSKPFNPDKAKPLSKSSAVKSSAAKSQVKKLPAKRSPAKKTAKKSPIKRKSR